MTENEVEEEDLKKIMKERGFSDWDIEVAIEGFKLGAKMSLGDDKQYVLKK